MGAESFLLMRFYYMRQSGIQHAVSVRGSVAENGVGLKNVLPETLIQEIKRHQRGSNRASDHPEHPNNESHLLGDKAARRSADLSPTE